MHAPIDPQIFRAYDIRGKAEEQLTREGCFLIAQAFGTELSERYGTDAPTVCVGRDARTSSPAFEQAVIEGLCESGCRVFSIGQTPSPVNAFTTTKHHLDGGVQVTASHNPPSDNGLKLSLRDAEAFSGEALQGLRHRIERGTLRSTGQGDVETMDGETPYRTYLTSRFRGTGDGYTVVVDAGNGVAGPLYCDVLRKVGATVSELYTEPDGTFPNHPADPSKHETLRVAQALIREVGADIGFAFDGDGDRLGCIDELGMIRSTDEVLLLLAQDHLTRHPGAPIIFTVSNSGILESEVRRFGGEPVMVKVGHSSVEHAMRSEHALLGGEQSGHFFCAEDYFAFDDALVAALRLLSIVRDRGRPLSELCGAFPRVYQIPELRPSVGDEHKGRIVEEVTIHFARHYPTLTLDGARIDFGDGAWVGIRQSNTAPRISICMEARTPEKLREIEHVILGHLKKHPEIQWDG